LIQLNEGILPSFQSLQQMTASREEAEGGGETGAIGSVGQYSHMGDSLLEEERRLCYVAMTRARKVAPHL